MLKTAKSVTVARGMKYQTFNPAEDDRNTILKQVMGPSGNLRAPTFRVGTHYIIGYNADLYEKWVK